MKMRDLKRRAIDFLPTTFGLRSYGDSLMTSAVRAWLVAFGVILLLQFVVDFWAWNRAWSYGLPDSPWWGWPLALGCVFALAILVFDRAIITADTATSRWALWSLFGRFVVLCLIAALTAVPVELAVFESEIEKRIGVEEKVELDKLRNSAIDFETTKYDKPGGLLDEVRLKYDGDGRTPPTGKPGLIAEARDRVTPGATQARTDAEQALETYRNKREADRRAKIGPLEAEVVRLTAEVAAQQKRLDDEITGKGGTGRRGVGRVTQMQVDQLRKLQDDLTAAQTALSTMQNSPELATFDKETTDEIARLQAAIGGSEKATRDAAEKKVADLIAERDTEISRLRKERDDKMDELRVMDGRELAKKYGGEWEKSRGFMDRFRELREITDEDTASSWIVWGCRLLMVLIGLIILILKLLAKGDFADYYNRNLQMAAGIDPDLVTVAEAKGYTDPAVRKALGYDHNTRGLLDALLQRRTAYAEAYSQWRNHLLAQCGPANTTGFCRTRQEIRGYLETQWREIVEPVGYQLVEAENNLTEIGIPVPVWPPALGVNPAILNRPWDPTPDQLIGNGWKDPAPIREEIEDALRDLSDTRATFETIVLEHMVRPLVEAIAADATVSRARLRTQLEPARIAVYTATLGPMVRQMRDLEERLTRRGEPVPVWQPTFMHPVEQIDRIWSFPSIEHLREHYGFRGQEEDRQPLVRPMHRPAPQPIAPPSPVPAPPAPRTPPPDPATTDPDPADPATPADPAAQGAAPTAPTATPPDPATQPPANTPAAQPGQVVTGLGGQGNGRAAPVVVTPPQPTTPQPPDPTPQPAPATAPIPDPATATPVTAAAPPATP